MKLHDPLRPKNSLGNICLTSINNVVPRLTFVPKTPAGWYLYINVPVAYREAKQWTMEITDPCHIEATILLYENDPEEFLITMCGMPRVFDNNGVKFEFDSSGTTTGRFDSSKTIVSNKPKALASEIEF